MTSATDALPPDQDPTPEATLWPIGVAAKMIGVSVFTLRDWEDAGRIASTKRTPGGQRPGNRLYTMAEIQRAKRWHDRKQAKK